MAKKTTISYSGDTVGIFAMDPGNTTGVAFGTVTLKGSTKEIFERDPLEVEEITCTSPHRPPYLTEVDGSVQIAQLYRECDAEWALQDIPVTKRFFIFEDFNLRGKPGSLDRSGISPVRVTYLIMGLLHGLPKVWVAQTPEQAKSRWTPDRLRRAGLWVRGKPHGRDAVRHAALFVAKNL